MWNYLGIPGFLSGVCITFEGEALGLGLGSPEKPHPWVPHSPWMPHPWNCPRARLEQPGVVEGVIFLRRGFQSSNKNSWQVIPKHFQVGEDLWCGKAAPACGVFPVVILLPTEFLLPAVMECCPATFPCHQNLLAKVREHLWVQPLESWELLHDSGIFFPSIKSCEVALVI